MRHVPGVVWVRFAAKCSKRIRMTLHHDSLDHLHAPAYWSRDAIVPGIYAIAPMLPGTFAFGLAFGALCAQKHFSLAEVEVMMAIVYGGLSQFVAVQSWPDTLTVSSIATLALLTTTVNIRFSLMSASLRPWFGRPIRR
jgi:predicted branched-subunit amino acid permease